MKVKIKEIMSFRADRDGVVVFIDFTPIKNPGSSKGSKKTTGQND